jgi:hypothetical protein
MADVFLGKDFQAQTFPFRQAVPFDVSANSPVPWGQAIVNESFLSQAIPAGDTGTLSIDVELPSDYVAIMRSLHLSVSDSTNISWGDAVVGLAYQDPGGPYKTSVAGFPESEYLWWPLVTSQEYGVRDRFASNINYKFWSLGSRRSGSASAPFLHNTILDIPTEVPLWIPPQTDTSLQSRSMILYLENNTAGSVANSFVFNAVFDLYTLEQAYAAGVMSSPRVF